MINNKRFHFISFRVVCCAVLFVGSFHLLNVCWCASIIFRVLFFWLPFFPPQLNEFSFFSNHLLSFHFNTRYKMPFYFKCTKCCGVFCVRVCVRIVFSATPLCIVLKCHVAGHVNAIALKVCTYDYQNGNELLSYSFYLAFIWAVWRMRRT